MVSVKDDDCDTQDPEEPLGLAPNTRGKENGIENDENSYGCESSQESREGRIFHGEGIVRVKGAMGMAPGSLRKPLRSGRFMISLSGTILSRLDWVWILTPSRMVLAP